MLDSYPPQLQTFIQQKIASGAFHSVEEFALEAAELYIEVDRRREELKSKIAAAIARVESGESLDIEAGDELWDYRNEINAEASRRSTGKTIAS